jgi:hypothetical protein
MELSSQGFNQSDIAFALKVDRSIICRDVAYLRHQAQENLQHHIHEVIPAEYEKAMNSLNQVLRLTWAIVSKTPDEKTRLQAMSLITECNKYKIDLATNGTIVTDALNCVQGKMESLNNNNSKQTMKGESETEIKEKDKTTTNSVF